MLNNENKIICVTGASGYIATYIVRDLLEKGYKVNGTVRDPTDEKKNELLTSLKNASTHLKLFKAELNVENAFDEAVKGAFAVIHVASPFFMTAVDPEKEIVQTAITGTKNILSSCSKYGIKTVLYTSSGTAMFFKNAPKDHIFSEEDWSDEELMRKSNLWYQLSKTLAEKAFWEWSNSNKDVRCVAVIPSLVSGPPLQSSPNTSNKLFLQYLDGSKKTIANYPTSIVDVRDVATGHILALEKEVTGRYFITAEGTNFLKICDTFRKLFPERSDKIPTSVELKEGEELKPPIKVNNQKAISLGLKFIDIEQSLKETIEVAIKSGFLI